MSADNVTLFDTDMFLNRVSPDENITTAATNYFAQNQPTGICSFSFVELKGNYIQDLVLLHKKIYVSDNFKQAFVKIQNTGGRKSTLMLAQLINCLGGDNYQINPWPEAKRELLSIIDCQIASSLVEFRKMSDFLLDELNCDRAREMPEDDEGGWQVSIHHCRKGNTNCRIQEFMSRYVRQMKALVLSLSESKELSDELKRILSVTSEMLEKKYFPYEGRTCRAVGDLIIALHGIDMKALVSSNYKEHNVLCKSLQYTYLEFPVSSIRSK